MKKEKFWYNAKIRFR